MAPTVGQSFVSHKSGFAGIIAEVVMESSSLYRVRIVNDEGIEKWSMVQV